jgi:predicted RNase H-related nuclease YkuK (DUF458 family)
MDRFRDGYFYNPSRGRLSFSEVIEEILTYMAEKPNQSYDLVVGCDSSSGVDAFFPVAIVVLRKKAGGRFFLKKIHFPAKERKKFINWKMRILQEVMLSCELALSLKEEVAKRLKDLAAVPDYEFRYIHADVGSSGDTKNMIKEVTGLIRGNGFEPRIKPDSYVASSVADKYC